LDKSFLIETRAAARGVLALLIGDRGAAGHFVFTQAGLVGSFIALIAVTGLQLAIASTFIPGGLLIALIQNTVLYGALVGASLLYLRQIARIDAFLPFLVTLNWSNAVLSLGLIGSSLLGLDFVTIVIAIAVIIVVINTARLIMTLKPLQVGILMLAQLVGVLAALVLLVLVFPPTPEQLAEVSAAMGSLPQ
jgi:hypothetical protein